MTISTDEGVFFDGIFVKRKKGELDKDVAERYHKMKSKVKKKEKKQ